MRRIGNEELKKIQLDILVDVDKYCVNNNISYSLAYGTLIGAVRHKGYIPWDDDIDIIMPRTDYERFVREFNGVYDNLKVVSPYTNKKYYAPYANIINTETVLFESVEHGIEIGVKIDVFPIDNVPNTKDEQRNLFNDVRRLTRYINIMSSKGKGVGNGIKSRLYYFFVSLFMPCVSYPRKLNDIALESNDKNAGSDYVNNIVWCAAKEKGCFKKQDMDKFVEVEFEGHHFKAIVGYDDFLTAHYGNYMQLPPEEKRVTHHTFEAYWK